MAHYKLILEDEEKENFSLVAIHCSLEAYKMAFILNKHIHFRLLRRRVDLEFSKEGLEVTFPLFEFIDQQHYTNYYLVANKCKTLKARNVASGGLFGDDVSEETITHYLMPENKKVDFFLKVDSEYDQVPIRKLLMQLNEVNEIISAYTVETNTLKNKENLIFD